MPVLKMTASAESVPTGAVAHAHLVYARVSPQLVTPEMSQVFQMVSRLVALPGGVPQNAIDLIHCIGIADGVSTARV